MHFGDDDVKKLSPTNQAMRNIDHMEPEMHLASGLRCEEVSVIHSPVPRRAVWMMRVFACISMLLSAALFVLWAIFAFAFGLLLTAAHGTALGAFVVTAFVISIFGAVAYLLTTLFVAVLLRCSLCYRCRSSNATRLSCYEAVIVLTWLSVVLVGALATAMEVIACYMMEDLDKRPHSDLDLVTKAVIACALYAATVDAVTTSFLSSIAVEVP
ncbi:putative integral membrane protein [Leishmania donovani]|uniref:Putative integral membrane protein n=1 Tax=Leishmania donovani TaxID=5661 RepID=A0A504XRQ6_LEIDO|nr:putative integral membrane protein [Leishmania donovani]